MEPASPEGDITEVLSRHAQGGSDLVDELLPLVWSDLHRLARGLMQRERNDHTLQPGALVNELYLKLRQTHLSGLPNRGAFFSIANRAMKQLLVDHARGKGSAKRTAPTIWADLGEPGADDLEGLAQLDEVFGRLRRMSSEQARIAELKVLAGYTHDEIAAELGVSTRTVERQWRSIRAWLRAQLDQRGFD